MSDRVKCGVGYDSLALGHSNWLQASLEFRVKSFWSRSITPGYGKSLSALASEMSLSDVPGQRREWGLRFVEGTASAMARPGYVTAVRVDKAPPGREKHNCCKLFFSKTISLPAVELWFTWTLLSSPLPIHGENPQMFMLLPRDFTTTQRCATHPRAAPKPSFLLRKEKHPPG